MIAYYSQAADAEYWRDHWGAHEWDTILNQARTSPLLDLILRQLPPAAAGPVLEAGCGLGQYVVVLRERGYDAIGADWLTGTDLRKLPYEDGTFAAYVSLGVVEHDIAGPGAILREAVRVLKPGGVALVSVPYVNVLRRLGAGYTRRQETAKFLAGASFYQYAYTRAELYAALRVHGLNVVRGTIYGPGKGMKSYFRWLKGGESYHPGVPEDTRRNPAAARSLTFGGRAARRLLYSAPVCALFGDMLMAVAIKPVPLDRTAPNMLQSARCHLVPTSDTGCGR